MKKAVEYTTLDAIGGNGGKATVSGIEVHAMPDPRFHPRPVIRSETLTPNGDILMDGRPGAGADGLYKHITDGTRRSKCRVLDCNEFTWMNIRAGYCAVHLSRHLRGTTDQPDKPGFPPMKECLCAQE